MNRTIRIVSGRLSAAVLALTPGSSRAQDTETRSLTPNKSAPRSFELDLSPVQRQLQRTLQYSRSTIRAPDRPVGRGCVCTSSPTTPPRLPPTLAHFGRRRRIATAQLATLTRTVHNCYGHGFSVWHHNVALIHHASHPEDSAAFPSKPDRAPEPVITGSSHPTLTRPTTPCPRRVRIQRALTSSMRCMGPEHPGLHALARVSH